MKVFFVNVWDIWREYGGPEEGGWWFDRGKCVKTVECSTRDQARLAREGLLDDYPRTGHRYSVLNGSDYDITIDDQRGTYFPETRPRYQ